MLKAMRSSLRGDGLAVFTVALALSCTLLLRSHLHSGYSLPFLAAIMVSAYYGGLWSGLAATVLSGLSLDYFFIPPVYSLGVYELDTVIWLAVFVFVSVLVSSLNESRKRAEEELRKANQQLEGRVAERTADLTALNQNLQDEIVERKKTAAEKEKLIQELQSALAKIKVMSGMLPICSHCKKIRDRKGGWNELELYVAEHSDATFSQAVCPDCAKTVYPTYPFITRGS